MAVPVEMAARFFHDKRGRGGEAAMRGTSFGFPLRLDRLFLGESCFSRRGFVLTSSFFGGLEKTPAAAIVRYFWATNAPTAFLTRPVEDTAVSCVMLQCYILSSVDIKEAYRSVWHERSHNPRKLSLERKKIHKNKWLTSTKKMESKQSFQRRIDDSLQYLAGYGWL
jgi:hypothetical protein